MWRRAVGGAALLGSVGIASTVRFARLDVSRNGVAAEGEEEEDGFYDVEVLRNKPLGANTRLVRFKLNDPKAGLPYTLGSYVQVKGLSFNVDESFPFGKKVCKPYLPVQALDKKGFFDVVVHTYSSPLGDTSRFIANRRQGDIVQIRGPIVRERIDKRLQDAQHVGLVVGGSGFTAALQCIRVLVQSRAGQGAAKLSIVCSCRGPDDLFYVRELRKLEKQFAGAIKVHYTLTRKTPRDWDHDVGRISVDMLSKHLPDPANPATRIVVCGPDEFCKSIAGPEAKANVAKRQSEGGQDEEPEYYCQGLLKECGFQPDQVVIF